MKPGTSNTIFETMYEKYRYLKPGTPNTIFEARYDKYMTWVLEQYAINPDFRRLVDRLQASEFSSHRSFSC